MNDMFKMGQGLGHQLEMAFARNDWTEELVNELTKGNILSGFRSVVEGNAKITPVVKMVNKLLEPLGKVTFEVDESINADEFLKTRNGLWVDSDLENLLGGSASKIEGGVIESSKFKLMKDSADKEIKSELPTDHIYAVGEFRTMIASAINKQWNGKSGDLINNGYANIFCVRNADKTACFVVDVHWSADDEEWRVHVCRLGRRWHAEYCVFSRN